MWFENANRHVDRLTKINLNHVLINNFHIGKISSLKLHNVRRMTFKQMKLQQCRMIKNDETFVLSKRTIYITQINFNRHYAM